jgi:hypothetical protein
MHMFWSIDRADMVVGPNASRYLDLRCPVRLGIIQQGQKAPARFDLSRAAVTMLALLAMPIYVARIGLEKGKQSPALARWGNFPSGTVSCGRPRQLHNAEDHNMS